MIGAHQDCPEPRPPARLPAEKDQFVAAIEALTTEVRLIRNYLEAALSIERARADQTQESLKDFRRFGGCIRPPLHPPTPRGGDVPR